MASTRGLPLGLKTMGQLVKPLDLYQGDGKLQQWRAPVVREVGFVQGYVVGEAW